MGYQVSSAAPDKQGPYHAKEHQGKRHPSESSYVGDPSPSPKVVVPLANLLAVVAHANRNRYTVRYIDGNDADVDEGAECGR